MHIYAHLVACLTSVMQGSVVFWSLQSVDRQSSADTAKAHIVVEHVDVIKDSFWQEHPHILS